ncbi:hypothetical protein DPEC_G00292790 [Dallia pectoralis]|uniref:Uncharacterized protein n=1 Tax=Dallia pectoralis TaxID=75939 RepID=A0ACC2FID6_DALPE|nr:hypothetical protein DPEC_G00292790 [Dallia pectoralis]
MASVKNRSQTLQLKVMIKDEEEEVKIWEYDDEFQEEGPEVQPIELSVRSPSLQQNVIHKEAKVIGKSVGHNKEKSSNSSHREKVSPASVKQHQEGSRGKGPHHCPHSVFLDKGSKGPLVAHGGSTQHYLYVGLSPGQLKDVPLEKRAFGAREDLAG